MNSPLVSILIVTWNRKAELVRSIDSALAQSYSNKEVVVMDNASTDGTAEVVRQKYPSARLIGSERNLGCPSGRNFGFRHCRGKYIYMLDDDGWLKDNAVELCVSRAEEESSIGVVMSRIHEVSSPTLSRTLSSTLSGQLSPSPLGRGRGEGEGAPGLAQRVIRKWPADKDQPVFLSVFNGGCSLIRKAALEKAGAFPEDFFRQGEETDLALRLLDNGYFCFLEPASIMYHAPSAVGRNSKQFAFYTLRNTNKTGLRLWPFPWCVLRPIINMAHACRLTIHLRYPALPLLVLKHLAADLLTLASNRKPVSAQTYRLFRLLDKGPSGKKPIASTDGLPVLPLPQGEGRGEGERAAGLAMADVRSVTFEDTARRKEAAA